MLVSWFLSRDRRHSSGKLTRFSGLMFLILLLSAIVSKCTQVEIFQAREKALFEGLDVFDFVVAQQYLLKLRKREVR